MGPQVARHRLGELAGANDDHRDRAGRGPSHQPERDDPGQRNRDCSDDAHGRDLSDRHCLEAVVAMCRISEDGEEEASHHEGVEDVPQVGEHAERDPPSRSSVEAVQREDPDEQRDDSEVEEDHGTGATRGRVRVDGNGGDEQRAEHCCRGQADDVGDQHAPQDVTPDLGHCTGVVTQIDGRAVASRDHDRVRPLVVQVLYFFLTDRHCYRLPFPSQVVRHAVFEPSRTTHCLGRQTTPRPSYSS